MNEPEYSDVPMGALGGRVKFCKNWSYSSRSSVN